jgi:hypothetical protein
MFKRWDVVEYATKFHYDPVTDACSITAWGSGEVVHVYNGKGGVRYTVKDLSTGQVTGVLLENEVRSIADHDKLNSWKHPGPRPWGNHG